MKPKWSPPYGRAAGHALNIAFIVTTHTHPLLITLLLFTSPNYHSDSRCFTFCKAVSGPLVSKLLNW